MTLTVEKKPVRAERLTLRSSVPFETAESRLRESIQKTKHSKWFDFQTENPTVRHTDKESFTAWIETQVGPHGFMYFNEYDHGAWLPYFAPPTSSITVGGKERNVRAKRFILGNPLIAITMLKHDLDAGLCVPVEVYLVEEDKGTRVVWYKPSGLIAGYDEARRELSEAAEELSEKLEGFIRWVLREEEGKM
jgi:hypothetical protein